MSALGWLLGGARRSDSGNIWTRPGVFAGLLADMGRKTTSGERVNDETARSLSVYWTCASGISEDVAGLPVSVVRRLRPRGREPLDDHPVTRLLHEDFSVECTALVGKQTMQGWRDTWGRAYAEIERDGRGSPLALWPIHPSRARLFRDKDGMYGPKGAIGLHVKAEDIGERDVWIPYSDVFHLRGWGSSEEGYSVLRAADESIGAAIAAQRFGAAVFGNDLAVGLVISPKNPLKVEEGTEFKSKLMEAHAGSAGKAHKGIVTTQPVDIARTAIPPEEAQYLETRQFHVEDVCRWFRRSPQKAGFTARAQGWSTIDALQIADVTDCLMPRTKCWETEARRKLLLPGERDLSVRFFLQGLMRGDPKTRSEYYRARVGAGTMTPNEVRELEDENPSEEENADRLTVQGATILLGSLSDMPPVLSSRPFGAPPAAEPEEEQDEEEDDDENDEPPEALAARAYRVQVTPFYLDAAARVVRKECAALDRALKKYGANAKQFREWAEGFYAEQRAYVSEQFAACAIVAESVPGAVVGLLGPWSSGLWPDAVERTGIALRTKESDLSSSLAACAFDALNPKESAR